MSTLDWMVLIVTLVSIIGYGLYKSKTTRNLEGYFLSGRSLSWGLVLLGIVGTQASAITFISAPGQAYTDGMRFLQYYFGLPLAMIVTAAFFVPVFHKLKVITAYEYLENRFDAKTRTLTSFLFLLQRGLSTGISVFAPSIILSSLLGWNIYVTNLLMGGLLIIYTLSGGAKAVAYTQRLQIIIIFIGLFLAGYMVVNMLPKNIGLIDALDIGGKMGKMNIITTGFEKGSFDWNDRYNIWSGIIGGFFLALSYFGTDQSQVGRYLTAKSVTESRVGLLMNGLVKIPMQFFILLLGVLVFSFYQFHKAPVFFNNVMIEKVNASPLKDSFQIVEHQYHLLNQQKAQKTEAYVLSKKQNNTVQQALYLKELHGLQFQSDSLRSKAKTWIKSNVVQGDDNDTNYIFLRFVMDYLPQGLVGLLIAIIFLASWGSIAAAINSLASSTVIDFDNRFRKTKFNEEKQYRISKKYTLLWGIFCIIVAMFTYNVGNSLIEAVNVLGSLFYGVILGVFLVAFFIKKIRSGSVVFYAAILAEVLVLLVFFMSKYGVMKIGFLWLNPIGALGVVFFALILHKAMSAKMMQ